MTKLTNFTLGLSGSHRTGKTTLACNISKAYDLPLVMTNASSIFKKHGITPTDSISLERKLEIQYEILHESTKLWQLNKSFVTDRTPLDMAAYMLMEYSKFEGEYNSSQILAYVNTCMKVSSAIFSNIVVVQPGIPLVNAPLKGVIDPTYIDKMNIIIRGLSNDERCLVPCYSIASDVVELDKRVDAVGRVILRAFDKAKAIRANSILH
ncbi:MAG: AAA family ATPase [Vibrio splendidus]